MNSAGKKVIDKEVAKYQEEMERLRNMLKEVGLSKSTEGLYASREGEIGKKSDEINYDILIHGAKQQNNAAGKSGKAGYNGTDKDLGYDPLAFINSPTLDFMSTINGKIKKAGGLYNLVSEMFAKNSAYKNDEQVDMFLSWLKKNQKSALENIKQMFLNKTIDCDVHTEEYAMYLLGALLAEQYIANTFNSSKNISSLKVSGAHLGKTEYLQNDCKIVLQIFDTNSPERRRLSGFDFFLGGLIDMMHETVHALPYLARGRVAVGRLISEEGVSLVLNALAPKIKISSATDIFAGTRNYLNTQDSIPAKKINDYNKVLLDDGEYFANVCVGYIITFFNRKNTAPIEEEYGVPPNYKDFSNLTPKDKTDNWKNRVQTPLPDKDIIKGKQILAWLDIFSFETDQTGVTLEDIYSRRIKDGSTYCLKAGIKDIRLMDKFDQFFKSLSKKKWSVEPGEEHEFFDALKATLREVLLYPTMRAMPPDFVYSTGSERAENVA